MIKSSARERQQRMADEVEELRRDRNLALYKKTMAVKAIARAWDSHATAIIKFNEYTDQWQQRLVDFAVRVRKLDIDEDTL